MVIISDQLRYTDETGCLTFPCRGRKSFSIKAGNGDLVRGFPAI
jgi:hypothetical protein